MGARIEWGYRCTTCHYARSFGDAKLRAEIEAGKHARKKAWHTVELIKIEVVHVFTARDNMQSLLNSNESPPF